MVNLSIANIANHGADLAAIVHCEYWILFSRIRKLYRVFLFLQINILSRNKTLKQEQFSFWPNNLRIFIIFLLTWWHPSYHCLAIHTFGMNIRNTNYFGSNWDGQWLLIFLSIQFCQATCSWTSQGMVDYIEWCNDVHRQNSHRYMELPIFFCYWNTVKWLRMIWIQHDVFTYDETYSSNTWCYFQRPKSCCRFFIPLITGPPFIRR